MIWLARVRFLYIGVSDTPAWVVSRSNTIAELRGWSQFIALQIRYSLIDRTVERELLPMARALDLAVTPWGIVGSGMLSGKYNIDPNAAGRGQRNQAMINDRSLFNCQDRPWTLLAKLVVRQTQVAIKWVQQGPANIIPLVGARNARTMAGKPWLP